MPEDRRRPEQGPGPRRHESEDRSGLFVPLLTACAAAIAVPAMLGKRPIDDTPRDRDAARWAGDAK